MADNRPLDPVRNAHLIVDRFEFQQRVDDAWAVKRPDHVELSPPRDYRHPETGRRQFEAEPQMLEVGRYLRRARRLATMSQQRLARDANVSQSMVSRTERGFAPGMRLERFVAMCEALGRIFPLGTCPHDHECAWQPIKPPAHQQTAVEHLLAMLLNPSAFTAADQHEPSTTSDPTDGSSHPGRLTSRMAG
jgi:transcriptional regulator with XRE-family HTH domain